MVYCFKTAFGDMQVKTWLIVNPTRALQFYSMTELQKLKPLHAKITEIVQVSRGGGDTA